MTERKPSNVIPQMQPAALRGIVHRLAKDTANISWSKHALDRMAERDIRDHVVIDVLRSGEVRGPIEPGNSPGEWKAKMVKEAKGRREAGVVVVVYRSERLFVKTAEWEDAK
jgi:hypothetical protein